MSCWRKTWLRLHKSLCTKTEPSRMIRMKHKFERLYDVGSTDPLEERKLRQVLLWKCRRLLCAGEILILYFNAACKSNKTVGNTSVHGRVWWNFNAALSGFIRFRLVVLNSDALKTLKHCNSIKRRRLPTLIYCDLLKDHSIHLEKNSLATLSAVMSGIRTTLANV